MVIKEEYNFHIVESEWDGLKVSFDLSEIASFRQGTEKGTICTYIILKSGVEIVCHRDTYEGIQGVYKNIVRQIKNSFR